MGESFLERSDLSKLISDADTAGYNRGYAAGNSAGYTNGYNAGNTAGYNSGYAAGDSAGYTRGYNEGVSVGATNSKGDPTHILAYVTHRCRFYPQDFPTHAGARGMVGGFYRQTYVGVILKNVYSRATLTNIRYMYAEVGNDNIHPVLQDLSPITLISNGDILACGWAYNQGQVISETVNGGILACGLTDGKMLWFYGMGNDDNRYDYSSISCNIVLT